MITGYVYDPIYLEHEEQSHPESPQRLRRVLQVLDKTGMLAKLTRIEATPVAMERLKAVHDGAYIERVRQMAQRGGGHLDMDTYVGPRSYEAALMAAGGLVNAVEAVLAGEVNNAFALVRPPGHHATVNRGMGFCLFNNVAVAARYALDAGGLERILIADWDVHHGNGTQDIFYRESDILYFSTHQYPHYPGTGHWRDIGAGDGAGFTVNVPLPPGVGDEGFEQIFDDLLYPLAQRYCPQLVLVSAGFDAHWSDPLASLQLSITGYAYLAHTLKSLADELCGGRLVFTLEGGYNLDVLGHAVLACFQVLLGEEAIEDPLGPSPWPSRPVDDLITQLKGLHRLV